MVEHRYHAFREWFDILRERTSAVRDSLTRTPLGTDSDGVLDGSPAKSSGSRDGDYSDAGPFGGVAIAQSIEDGTRRTSFKMVVPQSLDDGAGIDIQLPE